MLNKESLKARTELLRSSGVIDDDVAAFADAVAEKLNDDFRDDLSETFMTHLVMAVQRIKKGEPAEGLPQEIFDEVKSNAHFAEAKALYKELMEKCPYELPNQEIDFLLTHLTTLLDNKEEL